MESEAEWPPQGKKKSGANGRSCKRVKWKATGGTTMNEVTTVLNEWRDDKRPHGRSDDERGLIPSSLNFI